LMRHSEEKRKQSKPAWRTSGW